MMGRTNLKFHLPCMWTLKRILNQFRDQALIQISHIPARLINTFHLIGVVYSKYAYGKVDDPLKLYRGKDCVEKFCDYIKQEAHRLYHMFPEKPMDPLTNGQWKGYEKARECHICYKQFNSKDPKVRDHCLLQRSCPLIMQFEVSNAILHPILFHNLSGYDICSSKNWGTTPMI